MWLIMQYHRFFLYIHICNSYLNNKTCPYLKHGTTKILISYCIYLFRNHPIFQHIGWHRSSFWYSLTNGFNQKINLGEDIYINSEQKHRKKQQLNYINVCTVQWFMRIYKNTWRGWRFHFWTWVQDKLYFTFLLF